MVEAKSVLRNRVRRFPKSLLLSSILLLVSQNCNSIYYYPSYYWVAWLRPFYCLRATVLFLAATVLVCAHSARNGLRGGGPFWAAPK